MATLLRVLPLCLFHPGLPGSTHHPVMSTSEDQDGSSREGWVGEVRGAGRLETRTVGSGPGCGTGKEGPTTGQLQESK